MTDQTDSNKQLIQRYLGHLNARDAEAAAAMIADDASWWYVDRGYLKKSDIQATYARIFSLTESMRLTIVSQIAEGDRVATEMHVDYHTRDGRDIDNDVHLTATIRDGKLQEVREFYNMGRPPLSLG